MFNNNLYKTKNSQFQISYSGFKKLRRTANKPSKVESSTQHRKYNTQKEQIMWSAKFWRKHAPLSIIYDASSVLPKCCYKRSVKNKKKCLIYIKKKYSVVIEREEKNDNDDEKDGQNTRQQDEE